VDFATQRTNMVESQVRPSDVTDRRIIRAMAAVPREQFVPAALRDVAYMDADVPLTANSGHRRMLIAPRVFAKLAQLAEIGADDTVLDVGAATGYSSAILARLAKSVVALECDETLAAAARNAISSLAVANVDVVSGDLAAGHPQAGPYDAIIVEGAVIDAPETLLEQLKDGGRLVAVRRASPTQDSLGKAVVWRRKEGTLGAGAAFDAAAPLLPGFEKAMAFAF
jgi:protein-L-isoaspartate(D-aspartate) O-methyltransferase